MIMDSKNISIQLKIWLDTQKNGMTALKYVIKADWNVPRTLNEYRLVVLHYKKENKYFFNYFSEDGGLLLIREDEEAISSPFVDGYIASKEDYLEMGFEVLDAVDYSITPLN